MPVDDGSAVPTGTLLAELPGNNQDAPHRRKHHGATGRVSGPDNATTRVPVLVQDGLGGLDSNALL